MGAADFSKFDAFAKPLKDFRIKTISGALVTLFCAIVIILLVVFELVTYVYPQDNQEIIVDVNFSEKIQIKLNITYFNVPCSLLSLDSEDIIGEQASNIKNEILKIRTDLRGYPTDALPAEVDKSPAKKTDVDKPLADECQTCYGAESDARKCCNTCDDVITAYQERGWVVKNASVFQQCRSEKWSEINGKLNREGCQIHGTLRVNKVSGSFHVSPGRSYDRGHVHTHMVEDEIKNKFNLSHKINSLSFGDKFPGQVNALENHEVILHHSPSAFTYYLKLVPTLYYQYSNEAREYRPIRTNQYSATWHSRNRSEDMFSASGPLGVYFNYEISPLLVKISPTYRSFTHFLTNTCAIIGGVFTVASLFDAFIYHTTCVVQTRIADKR